MIKTEEKAKYVIGTLEEEHKIILQFLDQLEGINKKIQAIEEKGYNDIKQEIKNSLENIAEHLIGAEPHHQREEKVLFPELKMAGVFGPPEVMEEEHKELREIKKKLKELAAKIDKEDFGKIKKELSLISEHLVFMLRSHILKENDILYPTALEVIKEKETWEKMARDCDKIGYCCFTPR